MEAGEGSSPLTRGKPAVVAHTSGSVGLIPAHAGKTFARVPVGKTCAAHPRSRGENSARATSCSTMMGSSPLTRGKRRFGIRGGGAGGLIPAHAGKTCRAGTTLVWNQAHPRSRGENVGGPFAVFGVPGSSPLTRGKPPIFRGTRPVGRLIPAHAGKTRDSRAYPALPPAHPRSRGENEDRKGEARAIEGSSPLTRGKLGVRYSVHRIHGLIPAHAGKTDDTQCRSSACWAHPRSRGENCRVHGRASSPRGSSPLTRGKPPGYPPSTTPHTAHPRSRGENKSISSACRSAGGSSPLTRGKRSARCRSHH